MARPANGPPTTLNVAGRPFRIIRGSQRARDLNQLGFCDLGLYEIHLDSNQSPASLKDTALHEALHAISSATQADLEERQVYVLAVQILDVFKRNPEFTRWLLS